ncbi:MAG: hypothetical protein P8101_00865 [Candidatus Thiodiazotropha sp.]
MRASFIDYMVGWRFLLNRDYRGHVLDRWEAQPWFITGAEIISGIGSVLFSALLMAILMFAVLDSWFL